MKSQKRKKSPEEILKLRRRMEGLATFGLLLVLAALLAAVFTPEQVSWLLAYKITYCLGAVIYTVARMVNVNDPDDSVRIRRIRRLEVWAGIALMFGGFFWFYNTWGYTDRMRLTIDAMRDTILFTFVGAIIQIIASCLLSYAVRKKEARGEFPKVDKGEKGKTGKK